MPIYEYICEECERVEERLIMSERDLSVKCSLCFYATDYKKSDVGKEKEK